MTVCDCRTGSNENGWHEHRCQECIEADLALWEGLTERAREFAQKILKGEAP